MRIQAERQSGFTANTSEITPPEMQKYNPMVMATITKLIADRIRDYQAEIYVLRSVNRYLCSYSASMLKVLKWHQPGFWISPASSRSCHCYGHGDKRSLPAVPAFLVTAPSPLEQLITSWSSNACLPTCRCYTSWQRDPTSERPHNKFVLFAALCRWLFRAVSNIVHFTQVDCVPMHYGFSERQTIGFAAPRSNNPMRPADQRKPPPLVPFCRFTMSAEPRPWT